MNNINQSLIRRRNGKIHFRGYGHSPLHSRAVAGTKGMTIREVVEKYGKDLCSYCFPASVVERATEEAAQEAQATEETQVAAQQAPNLDTSGVMDDFDAAVEEALTLANS